MCKWIHICSDVDSGQDMQNNQIDQSMVKSDIQLHGEKV